MQTPKYQIGDTIFTSHSRYDPPKCELCKQPIDREEYDVFIDETEKHTVLGISVRQGMRGVEDGVFYQLSNVMWILEEEHIYATAEEALASLKASRLNKQSQTFNPLA